MKRVLDFSRIPIDKWVDLFNEVSSYSGVTVELSSIVNDLLQVARVDEKEESDIDKEIADKYLEVLSAEETSKVLELNLELDKLVEQKRAIRSRTEKDSSGQKKRDGENQG